jgi:flagellar biosynthesis protein FlhB
MSQERIFQPTRKKIADARQRGLAPQSRDLVSGLALLASLATLGLTGGWMLAQWRQCFRLAIDSVSRADPARLGPLLGSCAWLGVQSVIPLLVAIWITSALSAYLQVMPGGTGSSAPAKPALLGQSEAVRGPDFKDHLIDVGLSFVKIALLLGVIAAVVLGHMRGVLGALRGTVAQSLSSGTRFGQAVLGSMTAALIGIGVIDYIYRQFRFRQSLRMSREELDREQKETELDPRIKAHRRGRHRRWVTASAPPPEGASS